MFEEITLTDTVTVIGHRHLNTEHAIDDGEAGWRFGEIEPRSTVSVVSTITVLEREGPNILPCWT